MFKRAAKILARSFLAGDLERDGMVQRALAAFPIPEPVLAAAVDRLLLTLRIGSRPPEHRLIRFLHNDAVLRESLEKLARPDDERTEPIDLAAIPIPPLLRRMRPGAGPPAEWPVLPIRTVSELAGILNVTVSELLWFADPCGLERRHSEGPLRHYRYRWVPKSSGLPRLIESPKPRLKTIQRFILRRILSEIPPAESAHGFRSGRSVLSFAAPHTGRDVVFRFDLKDFFPSITRARIRPIFLTAGYPEPVAELLTALCVNSVPAEVLASAPVHEFRGRRPLRDLYASPHLPQGAPASPALANLCAFRLDRRLDGLARDLGAAYTRYADDLLFSGPATLARSSGRFHVTVARIALEEGFEVHTRKTRVMRQGVAQKAAGLILNQRLNFSRRDFDRLKAVLTNCVRHGPASQTRQELPGFKTHLVGRISWFKAINPARAQKLQNLFEQVQW